MTEGQGLTPEPEADEPLSKVEAESDPPAPGTEGEPPAPDGEAAGEPSEAEEPVVTLQEEFAELAPELKATMFGTPVQRISALLLLLVVMVALLIGLKALPTVPMPGTPLPTPSASPGGSATWMRMA